MKGSEIRLLHYMDGSDKQFVIPVYQRNYDWKWENCKQLSQFAGSGDSFNGAGVPKLNLY